METRRLSHTDLEVSRACFGTMTFGGQTGEAAAARMIDLCFDAGINFFDTANAYTEGRSETMLGKLLKGRRSRCILASKVGSKTAQTADQPRLTRNLILSHIDASLERLQTDYLDLYYLHMPDYATPIEETLEAMNVLVRAGKVRYPAFSNYAGWQAAQIHCLSQKKGYRAPAVSQPMYNLLARGIEEEYVAFCREFGVSMIVYNPLAGGLLTGKQRREQPAAGTRFDNNQLYLDRYWHPAYFDAVDELQSVARTSGRSMIDLSLNWLLHHTTTGCIILGASKIEQLEQSLEVLGRGPLPADAIAGIDTVWRKLRGVTPKYNR
jgi:1-deoxyxylulose-5-phosphate synthase